MTPIQPEFHQLMNDLCKALDQAFNPAHFENPPKPRGIAFGLVMFPFGEPNDSSRVNYISNGRREDMIAAMKEFIARAEGRFQEPEGRSPA